MEFNFLYRTVNVLWNEISDFYFIFTALHALYARRSSHEKAVRLSVRLSNAKFVTKRKKVVLTFLYHMKDHLS